MVRDYILHDRGNSLFLSESFGNLPSPVHESKTIKNLFKQKDEDDLNRNQNKKDMDSNANKEIKIEGKDMGASEKKPLVDIDVRDLDKLVFKDSKVH
jgi:hypothetical protein